MLAIAAVLAWFGTLRLRTALQFFQQEEYDNLRFMAWMLRAQAFDRQATIGLATMVPFAWLQPAAVPLMVLVWMAWRGRREPDPTTQGKKLLNLTERATRLWWLGSLLAIPLWVALALVLDTSPTLGLVALMLCLSGLPLMLCLANGVLWPLQKRVNTRYLRAAHSTLVRLNPTVVSISGAFGKTTTKYLLNAILSSEGPTLMPPGSTNTALGMARVILNQLQPHHQFFMAEMGAYKQGSIAWLCELFPPHACATTAIGVAHYERFKTLQAVADAEFEVLDATLARGGPAVLSIDCIPANLWQPRIKKHPEIVLVSSDKIHLREGDFHIKSATQHAKGQTLTIHHKGKTYTINSPLYGRTMAPNIATAFALATVLGIAPAKSIAALAHAGGAPHRLQRREEGSMTILDDSYNSNPEGFRTALETLTLIANEAPKTKRRRILITPGMVELGTLHAAEHTAIGTYAAQHADVVLVVAPQRIPTFVQALRNAGHTNLHEMPNLKAALAWLRTNGMEGDVVLLENDLPDLYETRWVL